MKARFACAAAAVLFVVGGHAAQLREKAAAYLVLTSRGPEQASNLRHRVCPLMMAGYRSVARSQQSAPRTPLASQPDVCDVSFNPDVFLCKSAAAANRSPAPLEAP